MPAVSRLSVNVNAIAMLRNRRDLPWPSVTGLAAIAMDAGAKGITVHPRPDERHIRKTDVFELSELIEDRFPNKELCLEGYPAPDFMKLVEEARPEQVLFVPDDPQQSTSDHGWDFSKDTGALETAIAAAKEWAVTVSLFCDPDPAAPEHAARLGAERIEIYTGPYGACYDDPARAEKELDMIVATAEAAQACGLGVNAGHDLTVENIPALMARAPFIREMSIGHGFTADALIHGFAESVARFRRAMGEI
ncbi:MULTISPECIES: pyridoxine 5'-phosphate synthase [Stappiaceae]|uniref:Pyridoxine 5'-phosphate synthase n=1 Tax=Roseibium aggregatum TaxID=187304 RepID=A0A0M6Y2N4_9HYPH|nr:MULTISPECIES: pyridoxine 5'-phosphate synthase [Stappiaceae]ERP93753.1 pyridoxine 5'-phosphate synthase [Labrenzia sp. C1B10]ERS05422.1 pyridoxine 5'-phosphate synthase [Labrenzia sp. C1B70]CTQ43271.1 Pyridoxine 5'-phosphate synthase [Roseibium aggregatum]